MLECLTTTFTSTLVLYLRALLEPTRVEPLRRLHLNGLASSLATDIRLRWKKMSLANTLAYYEIATITTTENYSKGPRGHATNPKGGGSRPAAASI